MSDKLLGLDELIGLLQVIIWSGQVLDERPVSAVIIAPAGSGKTSILETVKCNTAQFVDDITSRSLKPILKKKQLTHILLGDMLSLFGHKKSTVDLSCRSISKMVGEDIYTDPFSGEEIDGKQMGLITAIPPKDFMDKDIQKHFSTGGFGDRFLFIEFQYKPSTVTKIHEFIEGDGYAKKRDDEGRVIEKPRAFAVAPAPWQITIPQEIATRINSLSSQLKRETFGFRAHHHLRCLIRAHARMNARKIVEQFDYERVASYLDWFIRDSGTGPKTI